ncbi:helix-turn-helix domain-containing protein [Phenylobacterium sp.]|uniref:helix-turn-helix domain-containing protein n=1 Tax=Phenylobacterium sp. TaxID=1871053 RepID=UPI00374D2ACA
METDAPSGLQGLSRGLAVLTALNARGPLTLAGLSRELGLPRTTLRRIVTALIAEQCCLRLPSSALYALAPGVARLTSGYGPGDRLTAICAARLPVLSREIGWPVALAVPEGLIMRVRVATDFESPFALARMRPGYATPQAETTTGLLYLASLEPLAAKARLDDIYAARWRSRLRFARQEADDLIRQAREAGYLVLERQFPEASLGVPLRVAGAVQGGLVVRYVRSALRRDEARARLLPRLLEIAAAVEAEVEAQLATNGAVTGS